MAGRASIPEQAFCATPSPYSYLVHWTIADGWAASEQIPGVRIPNGCFMGTAGVAPSHAQLEEWTTREADLRRRGGAGNPPDAQDAVPAIEPIASKGLRTTPPRENCGNLDAKQLTRGSRLMIPVAVKGALFSVGDGHFAQGDGESCISAIEIGATVSLRFNLHRGEAARHKIRWPRYAYPMGRDGDATSRGGRIATIGVPIRDDGRQEGEDLTPRGAQRAPQHDRASAGAWLHARAGLRHLQRGGRSPHKQLREPSERRSLGQPPRMHIQLSRHHP